MVRLPQSCCNAAWVVLPAIEIQTKALPSAWVLAEHDPPATAWRGECPQRGIRPHRDLPGAGRTAQLLDAVGVHGRPRPAVPQIAAARA